MEESTITRLRTKLQRIRNTCQLDRIQCTIEYENASALYIVDCFDTIRS